MLVSIGTVLGTITCLTGTSVVPFWGMVAFTTTVPETVPVSSIVPAGNVATVLFAGIVKLTVFKLLENITVGSSRGTTLFDVNERFSVPDIGFDGADETVKPMATCCAGCMVSGTFVRVTVVLMTVMANAFVAVRDALSRTCTVKFAAPAVGVPLIIPPPDSVRPTPDSVPCVTDHVYDGVPPVAARLWE